MCVYHSWLGVEWAKKMSLQSFASLGQVYLYFVCLAGSLVGLRTDVLPDAWKKQIQILYRGQEFKLRLQKFIDKGAKLWRQIKNHKTRKEIIVRSISWKQQTEQSELRSWQISEITNRKYEMYMFEIK